MRAIPKIIAATIVAIMISTGWSFAQIDTFSGFQTHNTDNSVYTAMQNIWYANEKISYLSPLPEIKSQQPPVIPLREGESVKEKYVLEGSLYYQLPILMGRNHGNHFWQTSRLTFDVGFNIRMAQDTSSPLVPNNNIAGITLNKVIFNSYTDRKVIKGNKMKYVFDDWSELGKPLHSLSFDATLHHYSNGQPIGFFLRDTIDGVPKQRNDYRKGDFSTNYMRVGLTYSFLTKSRQLFSANLSYQLDGTIGGPLVYSDEQNKSYGRSRLLGFVQCRFLFQRNTVKHTIAYTTCGKKRVCVKNHSYDELIVRWEPEYILDDISRYSAPDGKDHRFNNHFYIQYTRPNWRALGVVFYAFTGRDYSNIRFDLPIRAAMLGVSVNFNKYVPALTTEQKRSGPATDLPACERCYSPKKKKRKNC